MERKNSFDSYPIRDFADGEGGIYPSLASANDHALEELDPFFVSFSNPHMDLYRITRFELGNIGPHLFSIHCLQRVHCISLSTQPPNNLICVSNIDSQVSGIDCLTCSSKGFVAVM